MTNETRSDDAFDRGLRAFVGRSLGPPTPGLLPVNDAMIAHWVDVFEYPTVPGTDTAPAPMLQVWMMRTFHEQISRERPAGVRADLFRHLEEGGFGPVVATNCEQRYDRPLRVGEEIVTEEIIESISDRKDTQLGTGYFITTLITFRVGDETVGTQRWTLFKYRARTDADTPDPEPADETKEDRPPRPRPAVNRDNQFWFDAARRRELLIQRCDDCGELRHPPGPCCPRCNSFEWTTIQAAGGATLHSFVVNHHPRVPAFDYPLPVALVDLDEGTRLIANTEDIDPDDLEIGMRLELAWREWDDDLTLPVFRPARKDTP